MYMIWCGTVNLSDYFDTILWIIFPWMNKLLKRPCQNLVSFVSLTESLIHSPCKSWHKVLFLRSQYTCSCYVICKTIFIKSGIKIIRKNYSAYPSHIRPLFTLYFVNNEQLKSVAFLLTRHGRRLKNLQQVFNIEEVRLKSRAQFCFHVLCHTQNDLQSVQL